VNCLAPLEQLIHKRKDETVGCAFKSSPTFRERMRELMKSCQAFGIVRDSQRCQCRAILVECSQGVTVRMRIETNRDHVAVYLL